MNTDAALSILSNVRPDNGDTQEQFVEQYAKCYELPVVHYSEEIPSKLFHFYEQRSRHFVVVAMANHAGEIFVCRPIVQHDAIWRLVGGSCQGMEAPDQACTRLIKTYVGLEVDELTPLALMENHFHCQKRVIVHQGIAFLARVRGDTHLIPGYEGEYISAPPQFLAFSNKQVFDLATERLQSNDTFTPYEEIDSSRRCNLNYIVHKLIVKRIFSRMGSRILRKKIEAYCRDAHTIIDVACGDDPLIVELTRSSRFGIANDISRSALERLRSRSSQPNMIFTNHNLLDLPFRMRFDVALCKNVLHHMCSGAEFLRLMVSVRNVGRRLIFVDIENPTRSTRWARWWHWYYVHFLGDQGGYFLSRREFEGAITQLFDEHDIKFEYVETIKGVYMFAIIDLKT